MWISISARKFEAGVRRRFLDAILAADEHGASETLIDEGKRGADDLLLLALGEDDALGIAAHAFDRSVCISPAIGSRRAESSALIGFHVDDGPARDAGVHRRVRHGGRNDAR